MRRLALVLSLVGLIAARAEAQPSARPVVVELFTSQGCSSCPPAEAFLSDLAREGPDILPLGFHVTYWDRLGWKDPYALEAATERQRRYVAQLRLESPYTPQMVIDGRYDVVGSDRGEGIAALRAAAARLQAGPAFRATRHGALVTIEAGGGGGTGTIWLIGYDSAHQTPVARGENAGRTLSETNVVRDIRAAGTWTGSPVRLDAAAPDGERIAAILQAPDGSILGAARAGGVPGG